MPNYAKTIIYKLINYDYPDLVYVGSTTNFTKRKQGHKERCSNEKSKKHNLKLYKMIREYGGWENWSMIKICDYPCENRRQAEQEEDKYMLELKANMNSNRAFRTQQEYRDDNKGRKQEYMKKYREDNKDKINKKITCECGCEINKTHLKRHERTKKHTDLINQVQK